jgi:hypothetical protein
MIKKLTSIFLEEKKIMTTRSKEQRAKNKGYYSPNEAQGPKKLSFSI